MKLSKKIMWPVVIGGLAITGVIIAIMFSIKKTNVELAGLKATESIANQVLTIRQFYTSEVVRRAKINGVRVNYDFDHRDDTLPLPATLTKALGKEIAEQYPGMLVRLYSDKPFPHRKGAEIAMDQFELNALRRLRVDPATPVKNLEKVNGRLSIESRLCRLPQQSS